MPIAWLGIFLGLTLPFGFLGFLSEPGASLDHFAENLFRFGKEFVFNPLGRTLLESFLPPRLVPLLSWACLILGSLVLLFGISMGKLQALAYTYLWCLFWSPVANAWYFLPLLPLALCVSSTLLHAAVWIPQLSYLTNTRLGLPTLGFYNLPQEILVLQVVLFLGFSWLAFVRRETGSDP